MKIQFLKFLSLVIFFPWIAEGQIGSVHGSWSNAGKGSDRPLTSMGPLCTDGGVRAFVESSTLTYIGGEFTKVGTCGGGFYKLNKDEGRLSMPESSIGAISGVFAVISDGGTGYYVSYGYEVVHLDVNLVRDMTFVANVSGTVTQLYYDGTLLYASGDFWQANGIDTKSIVALHPVTGALQPFDAGINGAVSSMVPNGSNLVFGGSFTGANMVAAKAVSLNPTTAAVNWAITSIDGTINKSYPDGSGGWYVAGPFTQINGQSRTGLARISSTGTLDATFVVDLASPAHEPVVQISAMLLNSGTLYISGNFIEVNGQPRRGLAAVDATTGAVTSMDVPVGRGRYGVNVGTIATDGTKLYLGGSFWSAGGTYTGFAAKLNGTTGAPDTAFPKANGRVTEVISDGSGGWILMGNFNKIGSTAVQGLARIKSDKTVDTGWTPFPICAGDCEYPTVIYKTGTTLYVGGLFTQISGAARHNIASYDLTTMTLNSWAPSSNIDGNFASITDSGGYIYLGGYYNSVATLVDPQIIKINATTGAIDTWTAAKADGSLYEIAISGTRIYLQGYFDNVGGIARARVASLNLSDGTLNSWNPTTGGDITAMEVAGSVVYLGGWFNAINGSTRYGLGAVDATTGATTGWNPNNRSYTNGYYAAVWMIKSFGSKVYTGGAFTSIGGQTRFHFAQIDSSSGLANSWNPLIDDTPTAVFDDGTDVILAGDTSVVGVTYRESLAAVTISSGTLSTWNPNTVFWNRNEWEPELSYVSKIIFSGSTLYVAGRFITINGVSKGNLAAFDASGAMTAWGASTDYAVFHMVEDATNLFLSGWFTTLSGTGRAGLGAVLKSTGATTSWAPAVDQVYEMEVSGTSVLMSGWFTTINGTAREGFGSVDSTTGATNSFYPHLIGTATGLSVSSGSLFVGGITNIGNTTRLNLAEVNKTTGVVTSWAPTTNGVVNAIDINATNLYVGGAFTQVNASARNRLASISMTTGATGTWNPDADAEVYTVKAGASFVYVGGAFTNVGGSARNHIAELNYTTTGPATAVNINVNGDVRVISINGTNLYFAGEFTTVGGKDRLNTAGYDISGFAIMPWHFRIDSNINNGYRIYEMAVINGELIVAGTMNILNPQTRNHVAAIDRFDNLTDFNPDTDGTVHAMALNSNKLLIGGDFSTVGGIGSRASLAEVNVITNAVTAWNPQLDGGVYNLLSDGTDVFIRGSFSNAGGSPRNAIASYRLTTKALNSWDPNSAAEGIYDMTLSGNNIYLAGSFANVGGAARAKLAAVDKVTGLATAWSPAIDGDIYNVTNAGGRLFIAGSFENVEGSARHNIAAFDISGGTPTLMSGWDPGLNGGCCVMYMSASSTTLFVSGDFGSMGGVNMCATGAVDAVTGLGTGFDPISRCYFGPIFAGPYTARVYFGSPVYQPGKSRTSLGIMDPTTGALLF